MPIYEYRCDACGHELEVLQKVSETPLQECPECGKQALKKLVSAAGFRLKGSGWYETDFKRDKKRNLHESGGEKAPKPEGTPKPEGAPKPEGKPKADPAAKPAAKGASAK
jgi:putative FmdB family regulatory protein